MSGDGLVGPRRPPKGHLPGYVLKAGLEWARSEAKRTPSRILVSPSDLEKLRAVDGQITTDELGGERFAGIPIRASMSVPPGEAIEVYEPESPLRRGTLLDVDPGFF